MSDLVGWAFPLALLTPVVLIEVGDLAERRRARRRSERRARLVAEGIAPPAPIDIRTRRHHPSHGRAS
jgi:hypothetical protein